MGFSLSRQPTLSRSGHDRAAERRDDPGWLAAAWDRGRALVVTPEYAAPVSEEADGPRLQLRPGVDLPADAERYFLGVSDDEPLFAVRAGRDLRADRWVDLREIGAALGDLDAGLLTTAVALARCDGVVAPTELLNWGAIGRAPTFTQIAGIKPCLLQRNTGVSSALAIRSSRLATQIRPTS